MAKKKTLKPMDLMIEICLTHYLKMPGARFSKIERAITESIDCKVTLCLARKRLKMIKAEVRKKNKDIDNWNYL